MNSFKIFVGIVAVAAVGVITGILFSPAKGSETRKKILKKGATYTGALKIKFNHFLEVIYVKYDKLMDDIFFDDKGTIHPEEEVLQDSQII